MGSPEGPRLERGVIRVQRSTRKSLLLVGGAWTDDHRGIAGSWGKAEDAGQAGRG